MVQLLPEAELQPEADSEKLPLPVLLSLRLPLFEEEAEVLPLGLMLPVGPAVVPAAD